MITQAFHTTDLSFIPSVFYYLLLSPLSVDSEKVFLFVLWNFMQLWNDTRTGGAWETPLVLQHPETADRVMDQPSISITQRMILLAYPTYYSTSKQRKSIHNDPLALVVSPLYKLLNSDIAVLKQLHENTKPTLIQHGCRINLTTVDSYKHSYERERNDMSGNLSDYWA